MLPLYLKTKINQIPLPSTKTHIFKPTMNKTPAPSTNTLPAKTPSPQTSLLP